MRALPLSLKRLVPLVLLAFAALDALFSLLYTLPRSEGWGPDELGRLGEALYVEWEDAGGASA